MSTSRQAMTTTVASAFLLLSTCLPRLSSSTKADAPTKTITVSWDGTATPNGMEYGTDQGPLCQGFPPFTTEFGDNPQNTGADASADLHSMGATMVRTHDSGVLDWNLVYHDQSLTLPTDDPSSYNFSAVDLYLNRITDRGFSPYVRLGPPYAFSESDPNWGGALPSEGVPYNRSALVDVLLHTVMHINAGWGGDSGYTGPPVRYFEVWNEPDSSCSWMTDVDACGQWWNRSASDFWDLADDAVRAIKAWDPSLKVGANGCALAYAPWATPDENPYSMGLIDELSARGTPLDFFSWHAYTAESSLIAEIAQAVGARLDSAFGAGVVTQHVTEWFPCMPYNCGGIQDDAIGATAVASTLIRMYNAGVTLSTMYPACALGESETVGVGWGLFNQDTDPGSALWRKLTFAFSYWGAMAQQAPWVLPAVTASVPDTDDSSEDFAVLAGRDAEDPSSAQEVRVLVSSQQSSTGSAQVTVSGFSTADAATSWDYAVIIIDATRTNETLATGAVEMTSAGALEFPAFDLGPPAVALLTAKRAAAAPSPPAAAAH